MSNYIAIYLVVGFIWAMYALVHTCDNPKYGKGRQFVTFFLNFSLWAIAMPVWLYAKIVLEQDTLLSSDEE